MLLALAIIGFLMKKLLSFLLLALGVGLLCVGAQAKTLRLFVIGNSFSGNATQYLPELAKEGGHELIIGYAQIGGAPLKLHWETVEISEKDSEDPKGRRYNKKTMRELLASQPWDIATIQQASVYSSEVASYQPYARQLVDFIHSVRPKTEVVMHQTWAYRTDSQNFGRVTDDHRAQSAQEMWEESRKAYRQISGELGLRLIPVGDAFWKINGDPQWAYRANPDFDLKTAADPLGPTGLYSLHKGYITRDGKTRLDAKHAGEAGCYLGGLVWYGFLFGEDPEKVKFAPPEVAPEFAAQLRRAAAQTLRENGVKF